MAINSVFLLLAIAALELNKRLNGTKSTAVTLRGGTLDLEIFFDSGHVLQLIPDSSCYESWSATIDYGSSLRLGVVT